MHGLSEELHLSSIWRSVSLSEEIVRRHRSLFFWIMFDEHHFIQRIPEERAGN